MSELSTIDERRRPFFTLGDRMRKAMQVAGVSNQDMADYLGVSRNTISNLIHDKVPAKRQTIMLWALRTGVALSWLESGTMAEYEDMDLLDPAYLIRQELEQAGRLEQYHQGDDERTRRDSNPKPSDLESPAAQVITLDTWRADHEAVAS